MKKFLPHYLLLLALILFGCSTSKKSIFSRNQVSKNRIVHYHINTKSIENRNYKKLIENKFKAFENLKFPFVKLYYNLTDTLNSDCEIQILFDSLTFQNKNYSQNKHFSKTIPQQQLESDGRTTTSSKTVRAYSFQQIQETKLTWTARMKTISKSNNCHAFNDSFTESFKTKTINNTVSGDSRISVKDKIGMSKKEMTVKAIDNIYKKIASKLKKNQ